MKKNEWRQGQRQKKKSFIDQLQVLLHELIQDNF